MRLYCDNKAAINIAHNPIQHDWTKHIEFDRHFFEEKLCAVWICNLYVKTGEQLADILTKEVTNSNLHSVLCKLGVRDIFASAWGVLKKETFGTRLFPIITEFNYIWFHSYYCKMQ